MEALHAPVVIEKLARQPVGQLRMTGRLAKAAKVAGRLGQATAEMILPKAIGQHAGGKRVVGRRNPAGQGGAAAGGRSSRHAPRKKTRIAKSVMAARFEHAQWARL